MFKASLGNMQTPFHFAKVQRQKKLIFEVPAWFMGQRKTSEIAENQWCLSHSGRPLDISNSLTLSNQYGEGKSKLLVEGWKDGSEVKSTGCSFKRPEFNSQHHKVAHYVCNQIPGNLLSSGLHGTRRAYDTQTHMRAKHPHIEKIILFN